MGIREYMFRFSDDIDLKSPDLVGLINEIVGTSFDPVPREDVLYLEKDGWLMDRVLKKVAKGPAKFAIYGDNEEIIKVKSRYGDQFEEDNLLQLFKPETVHKIWSELRSFPDRFFPYSDIDGYQYSYEYDTDPFRLNVGKCAQSVGYDCETYDEVEEAQRVFNELRDFYKIASRDSQYVVYYTH